MEDKKYLKISVVMLNYNGLKYLKRTIPPILKLDYPNYEFIIVDNGSTDGSINFIKKFKKIRFIQSPRVREKNFACNYAIKRAKGEYILLLDNDVLLKDSKNLLSDLYNMARNYSQFGEIGIATMDIDSKTGDNYGDFFGYSFTKDLKQSFSKKKIRLFDGLKIGYARGQALFIKKRIWNSVGGYDEYLPFGGDDTDLGIKLWINGYKNYLYSKEILVHLGIGERKDTKKFQVKWKETIYSHLYTIIKNFSFLNCLVVLLGFTLLIFIRSIKQSIFRFHLGPFFAFFQGYYLFLKNLPHALKQRKIIQSKRVVKEDIFLKIKPPKFD